MREEIAQVLLPALATSGGQIEPDVLYTSGQLANILNVSPRTLERWRAEGRGPAVTRLYPGMPPRYRGLHVLEFLRGRHVEGAA
ncbi:helix-turn-helix domain-containing protein [Ruegeria sp. B32]|uniref:helix-turn-helix domain-containing protein n=1 Tax=Ruegeria sp. B32 TaxID=2867020 RepID=UPI00147EC894|nr:helix-turn-helix domain-containing protein [Ruegeria sp. B32]UWR06559.1 helix-turn-helix domain-containing protein [Ruegeria sp. B32]